MNVNVIHEECIGNYLFSFTYRVESTNTLQVADGHQPSDPGSLGLIHPFFFASLILPRFPFAVQAFKHLKSTQNRSRSLFIIIWQFLWHPRSMGNHQILQNMQENVCTELFQNYILGHKGNNGDGGCLWLSENCCFSKQIMGSNFVCRQTSRERSNWQIEYKHVSMGFYGKRFPAKKQILCGGRCLIFFAESWLTSMGNFATTSRDRFKCWNRIYKHLSKVKKI